MGSIFERCGFDLSEVVTMILAVGFWSFLVANGLYHYMIGTFVGTVFGGVIIGGARRFVARKWREHMTAQDRIGDLLDTSTPGGLTDLVLDTDELAGKIARAIEEQM